MSDVRNLEERVAAIEVAIAAAAAGDFDSLLAITEEDELSSVESSINVMLDSLKAMFNENRRQNAEIERSLATIHAQRDAIRALSTPVIEVWDDVLVLPLMGRVDPDRCRDVLEALLSAIARTRTKCAILDLTGVESVDQGAAEGLVQVARGARLLGADCIVTGFSPAIARTIVDLGIEFDDLQTRRNLKAGLRAAMKRGDRRGSESE